MNIQWKKFASYFSIILLLNACNNYKEDPNLKLFPIYKGGKFGFMNQKGEQVIDFKFDDVEDFSEGMAAVLIKDKWGYIRQDGKQVIEPKFLEAYNFSSGLARCVLPEKKDQIGFIDKQGNIKIPPQYESARDFVGNFAVVRQEKFFFIKKDGSRLDDKTYDYADSFSESLALIQSFGQYGFIDTLGNLKINPKSQYAENFSEGVALVGFGSYGATTAPDSLSFTFIDKTGKQIMPLQHVYWMGSLSSGLAVFMKDKITKMMGFVNNAGDIVIPPNFKSIGGFVDLKFSEGLSRFAEQGKIGYIDKKGNAVIKPIFDEAGIFRNGLALVRKDEKVFYIDPSGKQVSISWVYPDDAKYFLEYYL